jgi:UDP-2-acetamido-3-amino-2,3-dideoxy-glucuronate N-acetyltransferase
MSTLLIGCGYWGQNWAKTLYRLGELAALCDPRPAVQADLKEKYPGVALFNTPEEALQHPGIEAVVVATPVVTHLAVGRACLEAKKSVLIEKPLTLNAPESQELVSLAKQQGVVLAVGHILMHHPALLKLQQLIRSGELGEVRSVQCTRVNLGKVRNEENVWWSLAPHDLSILSLLLEESFEPIAASQMSLLNRPDLPDTVQAQFATPTGRFGSIHVSWLHPVKKHETVVIGTKKMAIFEDTQPPEKKLHLIDYTLEASGDQVAGVTRGEGTFVPYEMPDELLALEAKAFLNAVRTGAPLPNDGENGLHVVRMLETVEQMMKSTAPAARPVALGV